MKTNILMQQRSQKTFLWHLSLSFSFLLILNVYIRERKKHNVKGSAHTNWDHLLRQHEKATVTCPEPGALSIIISAKHSQRKACPSEQRTVSVSAFSCRGLTLLFAWFPSLTDIRQFRVKNTMLKHIYTYGTFVTVDLLSEADCICTHSYRFSQNK